MGSKAEEVIKHPNKNVGYFTLECLHNDYNRFLVEQW